MFRNHRNWFHVKSKWSEIFCEINFHEFGISKDESASSVENLNFDFGEICIAEIFQNRNWKCLKIVKNDNFAKFNN